MSFSESWFKNDEFSRESPQMTDSVGTCSNCHLSSGSTDCGDDYIIRKQISGSFGTKRYKSLIKGSDDGQDTYVFAFRDSE